MLYRFLLKFLEIILWIFTGKIEVYGLENLPTDRTVILAASHRSNWDPFVLGIVTPKPATVSYMAKEELFSFKPLGWLLRKVYAFPVNRENPSYKSIKQAGKNLKKGHHFGIFPTGSRNSVEVKSGAAFIQSMSKADIVPVAIQSPQGFKQLLKRTKAKVKFGEPIKYEKGVKYDRDKLEEVDRKIVDSINKLDKELDPERAIELVYTE